MLSSDGNSALTSPSIHPDVDQIRSLFGSSMEGNLLDVSVNSARHSSLVGAQRTKPHHSLMKPLFLCLSFSVHFKLYLKYQLDILYIAFINIS